MKSASFLLLFVPFLLSVGAHANFEDDNGGLFIRDPYDDEGVFARGVYDNEDIFARGAPLFARAGSSCKTRTETKKTKRSDLNSGDLSFGEPNLR